MKRFPRQWGFGAVMAIVILVILASLAAAMLKLTNTQQVSSAQDIQVARAWQAAKAGTDWGLFQSLQPGALGCAAANGTTLNLRADTGFIVTIACTTFGPYNEGQTCAPTCVDNQVTVFRITATACNTSSAACPDNAAAVGQGYIERQRQVIATN